ncbi:MAG: ABC-F family ATP-binding cassette domain-containing protein [Bacteroidales bacterium]|nr:ABC-F family ATP-binding cassette domain-containing protein [Bacteroidales bacterium]
MAQSYLQIDNLTKSFGDLVLFENLSLGISEGDRIGLIARNGSGKTTLLNIIMGIEGKDEGSIVWRNDLRVDYLSQDPQFPSDITVGEVCRCVRQGNEWVVDDSKDRQDVLTNSSELTRILTRLDITDLGQKVSQLSGGQQKRLALAHVLIDNPQFLILDEPTNHLDLEMVEWLEDYLNRSRSMTLLMVTHDRYFLDHVCNRIVELADKQLYNYRGNYNYYLEKRAERISAQNAQVDHAQNLLRKELDWMRRQPQARGHKSRSRIEAFHELEQRAKARYEEQRMRLQMRSTYIGSKIFVAKHVDKSFNDNESAKVILKDYNYTFARYEKMGIIGANGTGKSTYLKLLLGELKPDHGSFEIGETVRFGYYSQDGIQYDEQKKVIDVVRDIAEYVLMSDGSKMSATEFLKQFLFTPVKQYSYVYKLSGGEKRRLYLCTILMRSPNFLILDEPTNDLDIATLQVLEEYLQNFGGCVIVVSHDRYFMDKVVDHLLVMKGDGVLQDYPGNYTDYREWRSLKEQEAVEQAQVANGLKASVAPSSAKPKTPKAPKLSFQEKQEFERLEKELPQLEAEKRKIEELMSSGTLGSDELMAKGNRMQELIDLIDEKELRWLELAEKK